MKRFVSIRCSPPISAATAEPQGWGATRAAPLAYLNAALPICWSGVGVPDCAGVLDAES